jgi:hypothetical protein
MLKFKNVQVSKNLKHLNRSQQNSPSHLCTYSLNFLTLGGPWLVPDSGHAKLVAKGITGGSGPEAGPGPAG